MLSAVILSLSLLSVPRADAGSAPAPLSDAGSIVADLSHRMQDRNTPESERVQLITVLGQWGTDEVVAPLISALGDPEPSIRAASARALGWPGNHAAVAALRERVEASGEPSSVRAAALESLGHIGDESARAVVLGATRDPDAAVRGTALSALTLEKLASPTDRIPLLRQLAGDSALDSYQRCQAIRALGVAKDTGAAELLARLLDREPTSALPPPSNSLTENEVMAIRYRETRDVKAWAVMSLVALDARSALPLILKSAEDPADFFLRYVSVQALAAWRAREALPVLVRRLDDPLEQTRGLALRALGLIGDRGVVDPVLARLSDKAPDVRAQAVAALADLGDPRVRPQLEALQQTETDSRVQQALEEALAKLSH